jgi:hypothetical protein
MKAIPLALLSTALLLAPICHASVSAENLPSDLGQMLSRLDQDQSRRLTTHGSSSATSFKAVAPDQVMQALDQPGATALVVLGTRGHAANAPLSIGRVLAVAGQGQSSVHARFSQAYQIQQTAAVSLNGPLAQLVTAGRLDNAADAIRVETCNADKASEALNGWKGVRYVAALAPAAGASPSALKQLFVVPDSIRISIDGDAAVETPTDPTAESNTHRPAAALARPASPLAASTSSTQPAALRPPPAPIPSQDFEQHRQEQMARMQEERKRMEAQFAEQIQKQKEEEAERERAQMQIEEQEPQLSQQ